MPRKTRLDSPGALHHIVVRGIERRKIFYDDSDRDDFLEWLSAILGESCQRSIKVYQFESLKNVLPRHRELGISTVELARRPNLAQPRVSQSVDRGERIAAEKRVTLLFK